MRLTLLSAALLATGIASAAAPVDGWYTSVFGGYTFIPDNVHYYTGFGYYVHNASYNGGFNAGGRVGFQSNPMRYELEYTYLNADLDHFDINSVRQNRVSGYSSDNVIMANVYYDTPEMLPAIVPFLGLGIGYANVENKFASASPLGFGYFDSNDNAFAYQGTVGLTYNFAENYAINISYRYLATTQLEDFGDSFQAHIASAAAIYRFDYGNYK